MCTTVEDMKTEAREEGVQEVKKNTTFRMLKAGKYALEEIADITGLSLDKVEGIETGIRETKKRIAFRMLAADRYTEEEIANLIDWSLTEVKKLKTDSKFII